MTLIRVLNSARDSFCVALPLTALVAVASTASARLTITDYTYNADAALTSIAVTVDGGDPTTKYLTWDDFTPDAATPTTGTVSAGDGRLVGYGPSPGNLTAHFTFDPRDRLLSYSGAAGTETYDYHANSTMRSSSTDEDDRRFYYDASEYPQAVNLHDAAADRWSAWLDRSRFLDDGTERVVLAPRKDMACSYDAANETLQSYVYDAFGASPDPGVPSGGYDLSDNPFRYAGEYRDPLWGGYYLRARWYHPELPSFLSRDPEPHLNRYAYGAGNPVMNTDPSGRGVEGFLRKLDRRLNAGWGGHLARIFLAPLLGPLQIAAYPKQFWQTVKTNPGVDVFLALGIASEAVGGFLDSYYAGYASARLFKRWGLRTLSDLAIGLGSSIQAGASRGFGHFNWNAFGQGLEFTANPLLGRAVTGFNVRTGFRLSSNNVADLVEGLRDAPDGTALVFRERTAVGSSEGGSLRSSGSSASESSASSVPGSGGHGFDKPFLQAKHVGLYHERLLAITKDDIIANEVVEAGVRVSRLGRTDLDSVKQYVGNFKGKYEYVGKINWGRETVRRTFLSNPYNVRVLRNNMGFFRLSTRGGNRDYYRPFTNNCQHHAYAVLQDLGLR